MKRLLTILMLCIAIPLAAFTARASEGESDGSVDA